MTRKTAAQKKKEAEAKKKEAENKPKEAEAKKKEAKAKYSWVFEYDVINSSGKVVETITQKVNTVEDDEQKAFLAAQNLIQDKYPTTRLIFTQKFKKVAM